MGVGLSGPGSLHGQEKEKENWYMYVRWSWWVSKIGGPTAAVAVFVTIVDVEVLVLVVVVVEVLVLISFFKEVC